jgi:uncharacterized protein (TIGR01244 family)
MIRTIDETISVAPQIRPEDVAGIAAAGFTAIVNNRPDAEEADQPDAAAIEAAAKAAGLSYTAIPVSPGGLGPAQVEAMAALLAATGGPVLAFCRSGTRSCNLWALAQASIGSDPAELTAKAAGAGYDLSGIRPVLDQLSGRA